MLQIFFNCKLAIRFHHIFLLVDLAVIINYSCVSTSIECSYRIYHFIFSFQRASAVIKLKLLNIS